MKADDCIFYQLAKTSQSAARYWASCVESLGLTAVQAMVLNFLREEDNVLSRELGERTGLDSATLTGILDRLEKMDLVERRRNQEDRRSISILLSEKGKALSPSIEKLMILANHTYLKGLIASDAEKLKEILKDLRSSGRRVGNLEGKR